MLTAGAKWRQLVGPERQLVAALDGAVQMRRDVGRGHQHEAALPLGAQFAEFLRSDRLSPAAACLGGVTGVGRESIT